MLNLTSQRQELLFNAILVTMSGFGRRIQRAGNASMVSGTNILVGKVFISDVPDSVVEPGHIVASMSDQNENTRWISRNQSPVNATVDLEGIYTLNRIRIVWAGDTIQNYTLAVSNNGTSWTTIYTGVTNNNPRQVIEYTSFSATPKGRYLRITGHDRWNNTYGNSIWEVEAYGVPDTTIPIGVISNFRTTATTNNSVSLAWAYSGSTISDYTLRRDGTVIASPTAGATSYTDTGRTSGTAYNYTLTANYQAGGTSNTTNVTGTTTGGVPTGSAWLSGAGDDTHLNNADPTKFGAWRGTPVTYATIWTYPSGYTSHNQVAVGWFNDHNYSEVLNLSSGWPEGSSWSAAASGSLDGYFTNMIDTIVAQWGNKKQVQLSFAYEFNGTWMNWSINGQTAAFGAAWKRMANIVRARKGSRDVRIVLNFSGGPQSGAGATIYQMVDAVGTDYFDILGVNFYDCWANDGNDGNTRTQAEWNAWRDSYAGSLGPRGIGAWTAYAASLGKPISHPEWGLSDRRELPPVDNPFWMEKMHEHFASIAPVDPYNPGPGQLAGEAIFNTWDHCRIWPTTNNPNSATRYRQLF